MVRNGIRLMVMTGIWVLGATSVASGACSNIQCKCAVANGGTFNSQTNRWSMQGCSPTQTAAFNDCVARGRAGGVYIQHDARSNISDVRRTGQTNDFDRRANEHNRKPETKNLQSVEVVRTNDPAVKRGLENKLYDANLQAAKAHGGLNKVRPPAMKPGDKEATDKFLSQIGGSSGRN